MEKQNFPGEAPNPKKRRKTLPSVAPQLRIKIKDFGADNAIDVITQGWVHGCFAVIPESDFELTTWQIVHQPSGYRFLAAQHPAVLNESLPSWDICAKSINARFCAAWLSGWSWDDPLFNESPSTRMIKRNKHIIAKEFPAQ